MLEKLLEILGNSHFEAWVVGGVTGAIYGQLFGVFAKGKDSMTPRQQGDESPQEMQQKIREQRQQSSVQEVHHHHYRHRKSTSSNDDAMPFVVFVGIALLVALLFFAAYLPQIADTLSFFITTIAFFSVAVGISAALGGRFNTAEWWLHTIAPAVTAMGCFWVMTIAYAAISTDIVNFAHGLIANKPLSFQTVISGAFAFFRAIGNEYVRWMLFEMLAFIAVLAASVICAMQCVYYIALMNFRDSGGKGWRMIVNFTARSSGLGPLVWAWVLLLLSWFLASGGAFRLTQ